MRFFDTSLCTILLFSILQLVSCATTTTITSVEYYPTSSSTVDALTDVPTSGTFQWTAWTSANDALDSCDGVVCASSSTSATTITTTTTSSMLTIFIPAPKITTSTSATTSFSTLSLPTDASLLGQIESDLADVGNEDASNPLSGQNFAGAGSNQNSGGLDTDITFLEAFFDAGIEPRSVWLPNIATTTTSTIPDPSGFTAKLAAAEVNDTSKNGEAMVEITNRDTTGLTALESNALAAFGAGELSDLNSGSGDIDEFLPVPLSSSPAPALASVRSTTIVTSAVTSSSSTIRVLDKIPEALSTTTTTSVSSQGSIWENWSAWTGFSTPSADAAFGAIPTSIMEAATTTSTTTTSTSSTISTSSTTTSTTSTSTSSTTSTTTSTTSITSTTSTTTKTTLATITKPAVKAATTTSVCYSTSTKQNIEGIAFFSFEVVVPCPVVSPVAQIVQRNVLRGRRY